MKTSYAIRNITCFSIAAAAKKVENLFEDPTPSSGDAVKITPAVALCYAKPCTGRILYHVALFFE